MREVIDMELITKTARKYTILKIRYKLSFIAFLKNQTILEMWLKTILKCYHRLKHSNQLQGHQNCQRQKMVEAIASGNL